jgi:hypothetical protein
MFNREQINILNELSLQLTGVSSSWKKALKNKSLHPSGTTTENPDGQKYVRIANSDRSGGTTMTFEAAVKKGLFTSEDKERNELLETQRKRIEETPVVTVQPGELTFAHLKELLVRTIDQEKLKLLDETKLCQVLAYRIVSGEIDGGLNVNVKESDKESFDSVLGNLPDDLKMLLNDMIESKVDNSRFTQVDGLKLAIELGTTIAFPEESFTKYIEILSFPLPKLNNNRQLRQTPEFYNRLQQKNNARKAKSAKKGK